MGTLDEGAGWLCRLGELGVPGDCVDCGDLSSVHRALCQQTETQACWIALPARHFDQCHRGL